MTRSGFAKGPAAIAPSRELTRDECAHAFSLSVLACSGLALSTPTVVTLLQTSWRDDQSQQGPLILLLGAWLLWRSWPTMALVARPPATARWMLLAAPCLAAYVLGRMSSLFLLEAYALYGFGLVAIYALVGLPGVRIGVFPYILLLFALPIPFAVGWRVTVDLRLWISEATVQVLRLFGVAAARDGLTLYFGGYKVEIAEACSGMNSLLALTALGLCYTYLRRAPSLRRYVVLLPCMMVIALLANLVRILALVTVTLELGDGVAQGVLHEGLGFATFSVALALTFVVDEVVAHWAAARRVPDGAPSDSA